MQIWARCLLLSATVGIFLFPSCQRSYHTDNEIYFLVGMNLESPYWQEVEYGFNGGVSWLGDEVKGEVVGPPQRNVEAQLQAFRDAVASNPAGILVSPANPELFTEVIDQAIDQGIPVICIDSDAPESKRIMFIGTDQQGDELAGTGKKAQINFPARLSSHSPRRHRSLERSDIILFHHRRPRVDQDR